MASREQQAAALQLAWDTDPRWTGVVRNYSAADVVRLRGSLAIEHTLARRGADKLWNLLHAEAYVNALGAASGNQAAQQIKAGLKAVYLSGWRGDGDLVPDLPLQLLCINKALQRADQIQWSDGTGDIDYYAPVIADGGFGGVLGPYELTTAMIGAGAAAVHFDDQLASSKHQAHPGGKVLVPTREAVENLRAARLAADAMGTATLIIARTDAEAATLLTSDVDADDQPFCTGERSADGLYKVRAGFEHALARALAYAPFADLLWCETGKPDLQFAKAFAEAVHEQFPGKMLAYHCAPWFNWKKSLDDATIAKFQKELGAMGYKFQFIALAGLPALEDSMFQLAHGYARRQMTAFVELQEAEWAAARALRHHHEACFSDNKLVA